ncbi:CAAX amino protease [Pullulanibacillus camelliae]|uniref:CAAX amino protease n=1 Tax=Pullulanibacillus camelliae TaxID=1707096 RepID=A0A8J2VUB7_9BACL|nr:CPBP family intramembrane glutamic endopeptidase [Pullulanibacillus camelliae]GGE38469.1 CAAX amino protease [Pullulanibacillus camelliae]
MAKRIDLHTISDRQMVKGFYISQGFLLFVSMILLTMFHFFIHPLPPLFTWDIKAVLLWGVLVGTLVAGAEYLLDRVFPDHWMDDGGVNRRLFAAMSFKQISLAMLLVAFIEEWLFRGVIQTYFGWIVASVIFGVIHFRYLHKPVMLVIVLLLGFLLGYIFKVSGSLWPPVICHYVIDVLLGIVLKMSIIKEAKQKEGRDQHE